VDQVMDEQLGNGRGVVLALVPDVFFAVTVRNTIRRLGYDPHLLKTPDDLVVAAGERDAVLAVVDLQAVHSPGEWLDIGDLVGDGLPVLVFGAHRDVEGLRAARDAGVTRVVSNGQFHREMSDLIQRYALAASCALADSADDEDAPLGSLPPGMTGHLTGDILTTAMVEK
jgi:hypothetical protein